MRHGCEYCRVNLCKKVPLFSIISAAKSLQSCPTLWDPIDGSPPGSSVPGILQARTLEWVAICLLQCMKVKSESEVTQSCLTQQPHGLQPTRLLRPCNFPGKSTGGGCHCLLRYSLLVDRISYHCPYWEASFMKTKPLLVMNVLPELRNMGGT